MSHVTVQLPAALRPFAGGEDRVRVRAATVGEALAAVDGGRGTLLDSPVNDGDVVSIIAAVAGG